MQKAFEDIVERLEELPDIGFAEGLILRRKAIEIVNQVAEENGSSSKNSSNTNDGWIPVEERYPDTDNYILLSFSNFSIPIIGRYEEDENGGAFYAGDEDVTLVSQYLFVNAWMPLVKPYRPDELPARTNGDRISVNE